MTPDYDNIFETRSEYSGEAGRQYRTPSGAPRRLSTNERAHLVRRAGIADSTAPDPDDPPEYGVRVG